MAGYNNAQISPLLPVLFLNVHLEKVCCWHNITVETLQKAFKNQAGCRVKWSWPKCWSPPPHIYISTICPIEMGFWLMGRGALAFGARVKQLSTLLGPRFGEIQTFSSPDSLQIRQVGWRPSVDRCFQISAEVFVFMSGFWLVQSWHSVHSETLLCCLGWCLIERRHLRPVLSSGMLWTRFSLSPSLSFVWTSWSFLWYYQLRGLQLSVYPNHVQSTNVEFTKGLKL